MPHSRYSSLLAVSVHCMVTICSCIIIFQGNGSATRLQAPPTHAVTYRISRNVTEAADKVYVNDTDMEV